MIRGKSCHETLLITIFLALVIMLLWPFRAGAVAYDDSEFTLTVQGKDSSYEMPTKVSGSKVSGKEQADISQYNYGFPATRESSFTGRIEEGRIVGKFAVKMHITGQAGTDFYWDGGLDNVVIPIDEGVANSGWLTTTLMADGVWGGVPPTPFHETEQFSFLFSADLTPLVEAGYEFAPAGTTGKIDDDKTVTATKTTKETGSRSSGAAATACAALAAAAALITLAWGKTVEAAADVGSFLGGLFGKGVAIEPAPPPVEPQSPVEPQAPVEPPVESAYTPPFEPEAGLSVTSQQLEEAPGTKPSEEKLRKVALLNAERRDLYYQFRSKYNLCDSAMDTLLGWLGNMELPIQEVHIRANLLVLTDKEWREFYGYVASKAVDNVAEGKLWEQAAKLNPLIKAGSTISTLTTMPWDMATGAVEYEDAQAAQRTLDYFIESYKEPESEVVEHLHAAKDAIKFWNRRYNPAEKAFNKADLQKTRATDGTDVDRAGKQAERVYDEAHATMLKANEELKDLEAYRRAMEFRLKAIRGDWKTWVVK